ncbi:MAG: electron transfer flavoprotein subunit beta/FixA family protein [Coxiellaceae bacterium]|nr:electron transfer flavoprotein subunit beta/FixA family protein [Coxiellaceae bacterium]
MVILVPVKRVVDYNVRVRVNSEQTGVVTDNVKMSINPFDEIAVEEALKLKESGAVSEVVAVTIGSSVCQDVLRHALAMGVDRAIRVDTDDEHEPLHIAKILHSVVARETPQMVIMGKQAIDDDCNQTAQMLAGLAGWGQATFASEVKVEAGSVEVVREVDGGLQTLKLALPAVISADLRLNEPRYVTLPNIMKSKSKPIETVALADLNVDLKPHVEVLKVERPSERKAGIKVADVDELLQKLREVEGVLS